MPWEFWRYPTQMQENLRVLSALIFEQPYLLVFFVKKIDAELVIQDSWLSQSLSNLIAYSAII